MHESPNHWFPRLTATSPVAIRSDRSTSIRDVAQTSHCANSGRSPDGSANGSSRPDAAVQDRPYERAGSARKRGRRRSRQDAPKPTLDRVDGDPGRLRPGSIYRRNASPNASIRSPTAAAFKRNSESSAASLSLAAARPIRAWSCPRRAT